MPRSYLILLAVVLYFATAIPVGIGFYILKNSLGWNVFSKGGVHAVIQCLNREAPLQ